MDTEKQAQSPSGSVQTASAADQPSSSTDSITEHGKQQEKNLQKDPRENLPLWKWILTLVGLYFGALLYGTHHRFRAGNAMSSTAKGVTFL